MAELIVFVTDTHCGSRVALHPNRQTQLDEGGFYAPSRAQRWLWHCWLDFWRCAWRLKRQVKPSRSYFIHGGDVGEGDHHDSDQVISRNEHTQQRVILACLAPPLDTLGFDTLFFIRGTEAYSGKSAKFEEWLAQDMGAEPEPGSGASSWYHLQMESEGVVLDVAHHGKIGTRLSTQDGPLNLLEAEIVLHYAARGEKPPALVLRGDKHMAGESAGRTGTKVHQAPSWQLQTALGHRIAPGLLLPVGGLFVITDRGKYRVITRYYNPPRPEPWRPKVG